MNIRRAMSSFFFFTNSNFYFEGFYLNMEMEKVNNLNFITTANGKFYAGMTYADAEKKKLAKRVLLTDFTDIDLNKNGKLSIDEIIKRRKKEIKNEYITAGIFALSALYDSISSHHSAASKLFWLALDLFIVITSLLKADNLKDGNRNFEQIKKTLKEKGQLDLLG